ncbi:ATP-binding protein [Synoicihabitans lomoniglobus]|uniref:histidine kinase n=1 Tax=Synoicihabitans lomoniglobus TaxID=2909285 RepID=A0AAF0A1L6_9BACT|nr:ATP-binding protein [Opitutaceae bacterium LMO-M01]WED65137.1 ATP-binding protein [Opitutaceae bacterium LMO-M01]
MTFFPKTLLVRTALYLGMLLAIGQMFWTAAARYLLETQVKPAYDQQVVDMVVMAQALIESQPPAADPASIETLHLPQLRALKIVPDSQPRPELVPHAPDDVPGNLIELMQQRFGTSVLCLQEKEGEVTWLRFPARGQFFWFNFVAEPEDGTILTSEFLLFSVLFVLAVGGSYLIVFQIIRKLRYVTDAAKAIGRGEPPGTLALSGPEEIQSLAEGFNQMSRDLIKLEAERRLMLAGISHDLRTPLTRMRIAVELAKNDLDPALVHDIEDMDAILSQFLDYARDGNEEQPAEHDLNALIAETIQRYAARGHTLEANLGPIPRFAFRGNSIRRVLENLIDNAVRYGKTNIQVTTTCSADVVSITVSDSGPGIRSGRPEDYIKPFAREDVSRSERGAGLGLTIADRAARLHGGRLRLRNADQGGVSVTVELPLTRSKGEHKT